MMSFILDDTKKFNYPRTFDALLAIETVHGILDIELLEKLGSLTKKGELIILALPNLSKFITVDDLIKRGYIVYRYFLRGLILVRLDRV